MPVSGQGMHLAVHRGTMRRPAALLHRQGIHMVASRSSLPRPPPDDTHDAGARDALDYLVAPNSRSFCATIFAVRSSSKPVSGWACRSRRQAVIPDGWRRCGCDGGIRATGRSWAEPFREAHCFTQSCAGDIRRKRAYPRTGLAKPQGARCPSIRENRASGSPDAR